MDNQVDLKELAIDRSEPARASGALRRHLLSRYVIPGILIVGFLGLVAWASWDFVFPPQSVKVVPVFSTTAEMRQAGTPLFQAAGWIDQRVAIAGINFPDGSIEAVFPRPGKPDRPTAPR